MVAVAQMQMVLSCRCTKDGQGLRGRVDVVVRDDAVVARLEGLVDRGQQVV